MNRVSLWIVLLALGLTAACGSSNSNGVLVSISTAPPGFLAPGAMAQVAATVSGDSHHAGVTWSCAPVNVCGSFASASTSSGMATTYTAPGGLGGVTITATSVTDTTQFATANVQISTSDGLAGNYSFYLSGLDFNFNTYSLAGAVTIAAGGTLTGEQDYNNANGTKSPAGGDSILAGSSLSFDPATGLGMLTLQTNDPNVGTNGTETLWLNFVNNSHALIIQADGSATSSGSFDLQSLPSTLAGGFSFTLSGARSKSAVTFVNGGVFSLSGTSLTNGMIDTNDAGNITLGHSFSGTLNAADIFGRGSGTFTGTGLVNSIVYYVVGPEVIRIIDMDSNDTAVGSAFGQGDNTFSSASIVNSVFSVQSNSAGNLYAAVGQIFPVGGNFNGVADVNEAEVGFADAQLISGTYSVAVNGYGSLTITSQTLGDVIDLGIYATDPNLNLNDPNNTMSGGGGALVADLDVNVAGSGVLVPQTDNTTASFTGNYALGLQDFVPGFGEFDLVGNAAVSSTALTFQGTGVLSDPAELLVDQPVDAGTTFTSGVTPDVANQGRYLLDPLTMIVGNGAFTIDYGAVVYQASGGQLFWMESGGDAFNSQVALSVFGGQIQQQALPLGADAKKAAATKTTPKP